MKKIKVAILGATSHIAKGLIFRFLTNNNNRYSLIVYTRNPKDLKSFLISQNINNIADNCLHDQYNDFLNNNYDVIINCIGAGTLNKHQGNYSNYFTIPEEYDNLVIDYLNNHPDSIYICLGSGAIYGNNYSAPTNNESINKIRVNQVAPQDYYSISRLYSEAKHRSYKELKIIDIRIFSYFSSFFDLTDGYFISELINSILNKKTFLTNKTNFIRDYIHPQDLFTAVIAIIKKATLNHFNAAIDITSLKPVSKKEIICFFSTHYNLNCNFIDNIRYTSATGQKIHYYSNNKQSETDISFKPVFTSLDTLSMEFKKFLDDHGC